jgi:hypothetical protein
MDSHHLETLVAHSAEADIVYSYCRVTGRGFNPNSPLMLIGSGARTTSLPQR